MTNLVNSRPFWGLRPTAEEFGALEALLSIRMRREVRQALESAFFDYSSDRAALNQGVRPSDLRKRLPSIAKACRDAAILMGGQEWFDDDHAAMSPPRSWLPREGQALEARNEIHRALMWRDYQLKNQFGISPELAKLEPAEIAWRLSHIASAADASADRIAPGKGGRPDGGGRRLVAALIRELGNDASLSCKFDAIEGAFVGSFVPVAGWLVTVGVEVEKSTLCQYAAEALRENRSAKKKPSGRKRVRS